MLLEIRHDLTFDYDSWIHESRMELRIQPRTDANQIVHEFHLVVGPRTAPTRGWEDWLGNIVHWFGIAAWHERIEVQALSLVTTHPPLRSPMDAQDVIHVDMGDLPRDDFTMFDGPIVDSTTLRDLSQKMGLDECKTIAEWVTQLESTLHDYFEYRPQVTTWESNTDEVIDARAGVCQDFAHVTIALARLRGIPTRYVNGYLHVGTDETDAESHAWVEFWSPSLGWIPYDPTHRELPGERHVVVAYGRHYDDCPPNRGLYAGNATESLQVAVRTRVMPEESARPRRTQSQSLEVPTFTANPLSAQAPNREFPGDEPPNAASQQQQ